MDFPVKPAENLSSKGVRGLRLSAVNVHGILTSQTTLQHCLVQTLRGLGFRSYTHSKQRASMQTCQSYLMPSEDPGPLKRVFVGFLASREGGPRLLKSLSGEGFWVVRVVQELGINRYQQLCSTFRAHAQNPTQKSPTLHLIILGARQKAKAGPAICIRDDYWAWKGHNYTPQTGGRA